MRLDDSWHEQDVSGEGLTRRDGDRIYIVVNGEEVLYMNIKAAYRLAQDIMGRVSDYVKEHKDKDKGTL